MGTFSRAILPSLKVEDAGSTISRKRVKALSADRRSHAARQPLLHPEDEEGAQQQEAGGESEDGPVGRLRRHAEGGSAPDHQAPDQRSENGRKVARDAPDPKVLAGRAERRQAIDRQGPVDTRVRTV